MLIIILRLPASNALRDDPRAPTDYIIKSCGRCGCGLCDEEMTVADQGRVNCSVKLAKG